MKTLLITLLLSISIFGQSGKSVLTQAQKDSVGAISANVVSDSLKIFQAFGVFVSISNEGFSTPTIIDHSHRGYTIDSIYAVTKDSSITFNLYNSADPFSVGERLFTDDKAVSSTTGIYYYPDDNADIYINRYFTIQLLGASGTIDEKLYLKIFYTLL